MDVQAEVMHDFLHGCLVSFNADEPDATNAFHTADRSAHADNPRYAAAMKASRICWLGLVTASTLLSGCIMFPINHTRKPLSTEKDFSFVRVGHTSRADVTNRLGIFDKEIGNGRVAYYALNETGAKVLWLMFPGIPIGTRNTRGGIEAALFRFDDRDKVRRFKIVDEGNSTLLENRAMNWAEKP